MLASDLKVGTLFVDGDDAMWLVVSVRKTSTINSGLDHYVETMVFGGRRGDRPSLRQFRFVPWSGMRYLAMDRATVILPSDSAEPSQ